MDRKQIHKIGKNLNKPVTFVKKNTRNVLIGVSGVASLDCLKTTKNRRTNIHRIK